MAELSVAVTEVLEAVPDRVVVTDLTGRIVFVIALPRLGGWRRARRSDA